MTSTGLHRVTVIGCGLIGTSLALALTRAGVEVLLEDHDPDALGRAMLMGAGTPLAPAAPPADLVVIATPPSTVVDVLYEAQARGLGHAYTDVADAKEQIWAEAELRGCDVRGYVPGRPVVGRSSAGRGPADAAEARADLFAGRSWIVCPYPAAEPRALDAVDALVALCGARRRDMSPAEHDRAVAAAPAAAARPAERTADRPAAQRPAERPADGPGERSADRPRGRSAGHATGRNTGRTGHCRA
ncbi:prephenate dehydrogenase/arogenate dehydrogenase family protein [Streptomyces sp. NPDC002073]|uniref:prephenate dehydrogenase/arogenate dehydrogenase family protein n=1 Tax=Streptomyces sp. NBC_00239 TaxID=2903640 RepID=UPI002E29BBC6|nr:prephenate dehydrogenase/arogenate dehydrogenase family protein [Streptomyces sp. NBC_00239]